MLTLTSTPRAVKILPTDPLCHGDSAALMTGAPNALSRHDRRRAADLAQPFKGQPPQLDALTPDTDVVTLTVGGNDIELAEYAALCIQSDCTGDPTAAILDRMPAMGGGVFELLRQVEARSPDATIVFAAYGRQLTLGENAPGVQHDPICEPGVLSGPERAEGGAVLSAFNYTLREAARLAGNRGIDVTFVSPYRDSFRLHPAFVGHSLCESGESFYRGFDALAPGQEGPEAILHLNRAGQSALADLIRHSVPELG